MKVPAGTNILDRGPLQHRVTSQSPRFFNLFTSPNYGRITGGQQLLLSCPPLSSTCVLVMHSLKSGSPEEACCRLICSDIIWDFAVSCGLWASWQRALSVWCHPSARKIFCAASLPAACEKTNPLCARIHTHTDTHSNKHTHTYTRLK